MRKQIPRSVRFVFAVLLTAFLLVFGAIPPAAGEAPVLITSVDDLNAALAAASDGDTLLVGDITFSSAPQNAFVLSKSVTIRSGKETDAVFSGATFLFGGTLSDTSPLKITFERIRLCGGSAGTPLDHEHPPVTAAKTVQELMSLQTATIFRNSADVSFVGCTFEGYRYNYGGAISAIYSSADNHYTLRLFLTDCVFRNNAAARGGAIYLSGSEQNISLSALRCRFEGNGATTGGAVWADKAKLSLRECDFSDQICFPNEGHTPCGGALALLDCSANLDGCLLCNNKTNGSGGAIYCRILPFHPIILFNCTLSGNTAETDGGLSVELAETNFETPAVAYCRFSSFVNNAVPDRHEHTDFFGCFVAENGISSTQSPCESNHYCLYKSYSDALADGDLTPDGGHVRPASGFVIPHDLLSGVSGGKFAGGIGTLAVGDNYGQALTVRIRVSSNDIRTVELPYGESLSLEEPVRKGYRFTGWQFPDGAEFESGAVYLGGISELTVTADWQWLLSEHLYLVWVPLLILLLLFSAVLLLRLNRRPAPAAAGADGESFPASASLGDWIDRVCTDPQTVALVSPREADVLRKLLEGKSRRQIAEELFITEATVKKHSASIYAKFGVRNRVSLLSKLSNR